MKRLTFGVAVNDADYKVKLKANGIIVWICPFYARWKSMLYRCYSKKSLEKYPSYIGCSVCRDWLTFSKFKSWMERQSWEGMHLDKDIIKPGNKIYSPVNCAFVLPLTNTFITDRSLDRGDFPIGVNICKDTGKFRARCRKCNGEHIHLGYFENVSDAATAWRLKKKEIAQEIAELETDERVRAALMVRYD